MDAAPSRVRILFVADTHLGIDLPTRPRVERRRRGADFFANFRAALAPARSGQVDLVVHGGDLLFRSRVSPAFVHSAFEPLLEVARAGIPVYLVPGNHERSTIPYRLLATHPRVFVFDRPQTFRFEAAGLAIGMAGFPYHPENVRGSFPALVNQTGWREVAADVSLLCMHQAVEGATVGTANFVFRNGADVVRGRDIPPGFAAVLSGHIHRAQLLTRDLSGRPFAAPVVYPGSIERTSFAERDEEKGYCVIEVDRSGTVTSTFRELPTRPMLEIAFDARGLRLADLAGRIRAALSRLAPDAVVRVLLQGESGIDARGAVTDALLRSLAPATMNVNLARPPAFAPRAREHNRADEVRGQRQGLRPQ